MPEPAADRGCRTGRRPRSARSPTTSACGITHADGDEVVGEWAAETHLHQPFGLVNGGAHSTVVETLASVGAGIWFGEQGTVVGVSNATDFYRGVRPGRCNRAPPRCTVAARNRCGWSRPATPRAGWWPSGQVRLQNLARRT